MSTHPLTVTTPAEFLNGLPKKKQEIAKQLQKTLIKINPSYEQKCAWDGLAFLLGKNYSCIICSHYEKMRLMIWRGVDLKDPEQRLHGSGQNTRHMVFTKPTDINATYLESILKQQFTLYEAGVPFADPCATRKKTTMPAFVKQALTKQKLMDAYKNRPPYQQRDYLFWITQAKREETRHKRLQQMLDELFAGSLYMKQKWGRKGD